MADVELELMVTGRLRMPEAYAFRPSGNRLTGMASVLRPGGKTLASPCLAYVVRHPQTGAILIDTGFHPDATTNLREDFGVRMSIVFRGLRPAEQPYADWLRERAVEPGEVERVVMTHLHVDHTSGMRLLPRARFLCTQAEWRAATSRGAANNGYSPTTCRARSEWTSSTSTPKASPSGRSARPWTCSATAASGCSRRPATPRVTSRSSSDERSRRGPDRR